MSTFYEYAGLALLMLWSFYRIASPFVRPINALRIAVVAGCIISLATPSFLFAMVAIFAPFGAVLPAIAAQNFTAHFTTHQPARLHLWELLCALAAYVLFLCASMGVFSFDPYRFGYQPVFGTCVALVLLAYTLHRRLYFIAAGLLIGQVAWSFDIASTNYFDHITHVALVPVIITLLIKRAITKIRAA